MQLTLPHCTVIFVDRIKVYVNVAGAAEGAIVLVIYTPAPLITFSLTVPADFVKYVTILGGLLPVSLMAVKLILYLKCSPLRPVILYDELSPEIILVVIP